MLDRAAASPDKRRILMGCLLGMGAFAGILAGLALMVVAFLIDPLTAVVVLVLLGLWAVGWLYRSHRRQAPR